MRKSYLLIAVIILLAADCKKDTKEIIANQSLQSVSDSPNPDNLSVCTGNAWTSDRYFPGGIGDPTLVYNNKVYVFDNFGQNNVQIYDGTSWTTKQSAIPFNTGGTNYSFVIGNKGYMGQSSEATKFYEYDFAANTWTAKAVLPGKRRLYQASFAIGNKGYVVSGYFPGGAGGEYYTDTWEYDPATDGWTQKASLPYWTFGRSSSTGFSIGGKGYIVNGNTWFPGNTFPIYYNSLLQYDPVADAWTYKASFPGLPRETCQSFVIAGLAYVGGGSAFGASGDNVVTYYGDFYKYYPSSDTWLKIPDFAAFGILGQSFSINSRGYVVYRFQDLHTNTLMEKYTPLTCAVPPPSVQ